MSTLVSQGDTRRRMARLVTEVLSPVVLIVAVILIVAVNSAGVGRGLALGLVAVLFAGVFPYAVVLIGVRRGQLTYHHISRREQRPPIMVFTLASVLVGLVVLGWLDAPRDLFALLASLVVGNVLALPITSFWKISIHAAAAAATVVSLAILVSPWSLLFVPLVVLTGWARVEIRDHTSGQVVAGATVGAVVSAGVLLLAAA